jgi:hypothetical protein
MTALEDPQPMRNFGCVPARLESSPVERYARFKYASESIDELVSLSRESCGPVVRVSRKRFGG